MVEYESLIMSRRIWSPLHLTQQMLSHLWIATLVLYVTHLLGQIYYIAPQVCRRLQDDLAAFVIWSSRNTIILEGSYTDTIILLKKKNKTKQNKKTKTKKQNKTKKTNIKVKQI